MIGLELVQTGEGGSSILRRLGIGVLRLHLKFYEGKHSNQNHYCKREDVFFG
jgi:hypothetical protein